MRFREAVAAELERRRRGNRRYSPRRFARGLGGVARHLGLLQAQVAEFLAREAAAAVVEAIGRRALRPGLAQ